MKIEPLSKPIFEKATKLGIDSIELHFSGGSDEGYLTVTLPQPDYTDKSPEAEERRHALNEFEEEIETWVWEGSGYDYCGAGDGSGDYGDDIVYDLKNKKASSQYWEHRPVYQDVEEEPLPTPEEV